MTDEEALKAIIQAAYVRLQTSVVRGVSITPDESRKVREVALRTLDDIRARVIADPAWLETVIAQVRKPDSPGPR